MTTNKSESVVFSDNRSRSERVRRQVLRPLWMSFADYDLVLTTSTLYV